MRHKWEEYHSVEELYIKFGDNWRIVGWVQNGPPLKEYRVYCHWIHDGDYPENKLFETAKQARRALKATATVAIVGGWRPKT
jgi:hypothetical protein